MLVVLVALYFVTMVASMAVSASQAEGAQRIMMFALPVIFTPFILSFPAGLIVYWITTNCLDDRPAVRGQGRLPDPGGR